MGKIYFHLLIFNIPWVASICDCRWRAVCFASSASIPGPFEGKGPGNEVVVSLVLYRARWILGRTITKVMGWRRDKKKIRAKKARKSLAPAKTNSAQAMDEKNHARWKFPTPSHHFSMVHPLASDIILRYVSSRDFRTRMLAVYYICFFFLTIFSTLFVSLNKKPYSEKFRRSWRSLARD